MACDCEKDKEMEEFDKEFGDALEAFVDGWREHPKHNSYVITKCLLHEAKIEACCRFNDYYITSGLLIDILLDGLSEMHASIRNVEEKE